MARIVNILNGAYQQPTTPQQHGEVGILRVRQWIEALDPLTDFTSMADYGDATGVVFGYDPVSGAGQILGLNAGTLQAYFDSDGKIKWAGGYGELSANGIILTTPVGTNLTREIRWKYGNDSVMRLWSRVVDVLGTSGYGGIDLIPAAAQDNDFIQFTIAAANKTDHWDTEIISYVNGDLGTCNVTLRATYSVLGRFSQLVVDPDYITLTPRLYASLSNKRITNLADAIAATDALNRQTGDARYCLLSTGYLKADGSVTGATAQAQALSKGMIGPSMTPDVITASFNVPAAHTALYNNMQVPPAYTVEVAGLLVDPGWS